MEQATPNHDGSSPISAVIYATDEGSDTYCSPPFRCVCSFSELPLVHEWGGLFKGQVAAIGTDPYSRPIRLLPVDPAEKEKGVRRQFP